MYDRSKAQAIEMSRRSRLSNWSERLDAAIANAHANAPTIQPAGGTARNVIATAMHSRGFYQWLCAGRRWGIRIKPIARQIRCLDLLGRDDLAFVLVFINEAKKEGIVLHYE